jgi:hypothetical protein
VSLRPPGGTSPPATAQLGDRELDLVVLARETCERYHEHYPDEDDRYGPAGADWCRHDNQWLLSWAVGDVLGVTSLDEQASWLAGVLESRGFPLDRLAHNLRIAADVVEARAGEPGGAVGGSLRRAAVIVAPPG